MATILDTNPISTNINNGVVASHPAMSWRSTVAGVLVSLFIFGILLSLGVALGGVSLTNGASLRNSGVVGGLWVLLSVLLSLFAGSYFSARVSNFTSSWTGMAQGAVVCALFVGFVLWQFASLGAWMTRSAGAIVGSVAQVGAQYGASAAQNAASTLNVSVNDIIEDNLGDVQLKTDPTTVMTGVASRIIRGNPDAAKRFLVANSNLTPAEVDARVGQIQAQLQKAGNDATAAAANAMKITGWSLFGLMTLGLIVSISAGVMGALANAEEPAVRATLPGFRPVHTT